MNILGLETSTFSASVAVVRDDSLVCEYVFASGPRHNEILVSVLGRLLDDCGLRKSDLDAVCVATGPGSFTSLRVGVSTAKTLCYCLGTKLAGVSSLEVLAANAAWSRNGVCAMIDAGRGEVYCSFAPCGAEEMTVAEILAPEAACAAVGGKTVFVGSGAAVHADVIRDACGENAVFLPENLNVPRASACALLGRRKLLSGGEDDPFALAPFYLRRSGAEERADSA